MVHIVKIDNYNKIVQDVTKGTYTRSNCMTSYTYHPDNLSKIYDFLLESVLNDMEVYDANELEIVENDDESNSSDDETVTVKVRIHRRDLPSR